MILMIFYCEILAKVIPVKFIIEYLTQNVTYNKLTLRI